MTISQLQNFFDEFHTIVGFDIQAAREEMFKKLEDAIVGRSVIMILSGLPPEERQRYDAFVRTGPTPSELRAFLESSLPPQTFETHFKKEAEQVVFNYTKTMLQMVTQEQKEKLFELFGKLLQGVDSAMIASLRGKTELST